MDNWIINFLYRDNKPKFPRPGSFYYITKTDKGLWFAPDDVLSHMVRLDSDINVGEIEKIIGDYVVKNLYSKDEIDEKLKNLNDYATKVWIQTQYYNKEEIMNNFYFLTILYIPLKPATIPIIIPTIIAAVSQ